MGACYYFSFEISIACWLLSSPNWRIVSKLTTDAVTYCTEASNQKSKYAYRKIFFYKKALENPKNPKLGFWGFYVFLKSLKPKFSNT